MELLKLRGQRSGGDDDARTRDAYTITITNKLTLHLTHKMSPLVLITRPAGQHEAFARSCESLGFTVSLLPCIEINSYPVTALHLTHILKSCQNVLFTSANAARLAHQIVPMPWQNHRIHAIGAATARTLEQAGQKLSLVPQSPYNSESYLQQLKERLPESLLIIKGRGGRALVQATLERLGWHVSTLDVYERTKPQVCPDTITSLFNKRAPDIISVTSDEILNNLWQLCEAHSQQLKQIPLVVNSQRCADRARHLGSLAESFVARPAGDSGQIARLAHWKNTVYPITTG